jgi:hypothetical protein
LKVDEPMIVIVAAAPVKLSVPPLGLKTPAEWVKLPATESMPDVLVKAPPPSEKGPLTVMVDALPRNAPPLWENPEAPTVKVTAPWEIVPP